MDTRILTLFDDEEFSPREEPKSKTAKALTEAPEQEEGEAAHKVALGTSIEEEGLPLPIEDEGPAIVMEPPLPRENKAIEKTIGDIADSEGEAELDKQIMMELVQTDYAFFIQKSAQDLVSPIKVDDSEANIKSESDLLAEGEGMTEGDGPDQASDIEDGIETYDLAPSTAALPEWELDKKYYTIGEVAQLFAVNTSHIRFWTNEFKLKPRTNRKGDRLYSPQHIGELRLIHHLVKEKKFTIKGAKEKLKAGKGMVDNQLSLKSSLIELRDMLLRIKEKL